VGSACVAVAYSGGRDSSALLHATLAASTPLGIKVVALHVHHGLSPHADDWLLHCEAQCARWAKRGWPIMFASFRVLTRPLAGESVEAWARMMRYRALRGLAQEQGASTVLLAQHRRDQAETFLLQAFRGAGPAGLASMPASVLREGITWIRPWLGRPREDIEAYVARHRIRCIEDESNDDPRFARNRLRLQLWPALSSAFPQAEAGLADSAHWAQEALVCLSDLATQDMAPLLSGPNGLDVRAWLELSVARRSNVLRAWLKLRLGSAVAASLVSRLMTELRPAGSARWPLEGGELRVYRGVLRHREDDSQAAANASCEATLDVHRVGEFPLPGWGGSLQVIRAKEGGVPLAWLRWLELRPRQGAEQFQAGLGRPPRSLKKQYQIAGVPGWDRLGPLFYSGGQLVFVPGLGIDARVLALPGQPQVSLRWLPMRVGQVAIPGVVGSGG
jgi:tRNA(Ile)-lysidine synthase